MKKKAWRRAWTHITRGWDQEPGYIHPVIKLLPPFAYELLIYLLLGGLIYRWLA